MQYTDLTRKELQREYSRLTRKYTDFIRQPVELDLTMEDPHYSSAGVNSSKSSSIFARISVSLSGAI